jgi:hypothetical protein
MAGYRVTTKTGYSQQLAAEVVESLELPDMLG